MEYQPVAMPYYQGRWLNHDRQNLPTPTNPGLRSRSGKMAFVWPRDGKRNTAFGRLKDVLQSKGPDIYIMRNGARPLRTTWTNRPFTTWDDPDQYLVDDNRRALPWAKRGTEKKYDFRTRKYGRTDRYTWADAYWQQPTGRKGEHQSRQNFPLAYKCSHGRWYQQFYNHRGDHGGFGPGADGNGPGFEDLGRDTFGHWPYDHWDEGLNFQGDPRRSFDDDTDALGNPGGMHFADERRGWEWENQSEDG